MQLPERINIELYSLKGKRLSETIAKKFLERLIECKFTGEVAFISNQRLLREKDYELLSLFRKSLFFNKKHFKTILIIRGDELDEETIKRMKKVGMEKVWVSKPTNILSYKKVTVSQKSYDATFYNNKMIFYKRKKIVDPCFLALSGMYVSALGNYALCAHSPNTLSKSKITNTSIEEFWNGSELREFRLNILKSRKGTTDCALCSLGGSLFKKEYAEAYLQYSEKYTKEQLEQMKDCFEIKEIE